MEKDKQCQGKSLRAQRPARQPAQALAPPVKKPTISRAKRSAGTGVGRAGERRWPAASRIVPHLHGTTPSTTRLEWNHIQHTITRCTTCAPHNEPLNHTLHNERRHDDTGTTGLPELRPSHPSSKKDAITLPSRPTVWHSAAASALGEDFKPNDLAREAVSWNAVLGGFGWRCRCLRLCERIIISILKGEVCNVGVCFDTLL